MATYELNKRSIELLKRKLEGRCNKVKVEAAKDAEWYLTCFGYHGKWESGPWGLNWYGWTGYYALNWNVSVNQPDLSVFVPYRIWYDDKERKYAPDIDAKIGKIDGMFDNVTVADILYVVNPVYYGKWLNNGGILHKTYLWDRWKMPAHPNRFMELCLSYIKSKKQYYINHAKLEIR